MAPPSGRDSTNHSEGARDSTNQREGARVCQPITTKELEIQPIMMSGPTNDTKKWIPRKMTEGPTRPLVNMGDTSPSEYYFLPKETLKDISYNVIFDNGGIGYDLLPTPLQKLYCNHIYNHTNKKL